jgi:hypothetical protein
LDLSYEAGIAMKLPFLEADLTLEASTAGMCGGSTPGAGVDLDIKLGTEVSAYVGKDIENPDWDITIYSTDVPLFSTCIGFSASSTSTPTPTPTDSLSLPVSSPAPTSVTTSTPYWNNSTNSTRTPYLRRHFVA